MTQLSARSAKHEALYARGVSARYMHDDMHGIEPLLNGGRNPSPRSDGPASTTNIPSIRQERQKGIGAARPSSAQAPRCSRHEAELNEEAAIEREIISCTLHEFSKTRLQDYCLYLIG